MRLIIVGSGIVGAACAYTASRLGAQVTLIDAARPGQATLAASHPTPSGARAASLS